MINIIVRRYSICKIIKISMIIKSKWKMRLIGHGKNKDKSSPYKFKPSMKRGKSAPPGG